MPGDDERRARRPAAATSPPSAIATSIADRTDRERARSRLSEQRRRRDVSTMLEAIAPLAGPTGAYARRRRGPSLLPGPAVCPLGCPYCRRRAVA